MTTAQIVETSVTSTNCSFQNYTYPDNHTRQITDTPGFKPFTIKSCPVQEIEQARWLICASASVWCLSHEVTRSITAPLPGPTHPSQGYHTTTPFPSPRILTDSSKVPIYTPGSRKRMRNKVSSLRCRDQELLFLLCYTL